MEKIVTKISKCTMPCIYLSVNVEPLSRSYIPNKLYAQCPFLGFLIMLPLPICKYNLNELKFNNVQ